MGCKSSKMVDVVNDNNTSGYMNSVNVQKSSAVDQKPIMSQEQMVLLKDTWSLLLKNSSLELLGKQIFLRVFELRPGVKAIFPFRDNWGDSLIRHPQFQVHAEKFMMVINACVTNCERVKTEHTDMLFNLGRAHTSFQGFEKENFDIFLKSILFVLQQELKQEYTLHVDTVWKILTDFVISNLREGYEAEMKVISKSKLNSTTTNEIHTDST